MNARIALSFSFAAALAIVACDDNPKIQKLGSLDVTTSAPSVEKELVTTDGWTLKYDRFLVHVTSVTVAGTDGVLAASASPTLVDQVAPGPKSLVSAQLRTARVWENVGLQIGPVDAETTAIAPATDADRDMMTASGFTLYVEGKLSKNGATKTFKWGFATEATYGECAEGAVRGLVVPADGSDTADVGMAGEVLFADDLAAGVLRADAIAAADADNDGNITLEELAATSLDTARAGGAAYTGGPFDVTMLDEFVTAQAPRVVARFRATGTCKPAPAAP